MPHDALGLAVPDHAFGTPGRPVGSWPTPERELPNPNNRAAGGARAPGGGPPPVPQGQVPQLSGQHAPMVARNFGATTAASPPHAYRPTGAIAGGTPPPPIPRAGSGAPGRYEMQEADRGGGGGAVGGAGRPMAPMGAPGAAGGLPQAPQLPGLDRGGMAAMQGPQVSPQVLQQLVQLVPGLDPAMLQVLPPQFLVQLLQALQGGPQAGVAPGGGAPPPLPSQRPVPQLGAM